MAKRKADPHRPETTWYKIKNLTYTQLRGAGSCSTGRVRSEPRACGRAARRFGRECWGTFRWPLQPQLAHHWSAEPLDLLSEVAVVEEAGVEKAEAL